VPIKDIDRHSTEDAFGTHDPVLRVFMMTTNHKNENKKNEASALVCLLLFAALQT